MPYKTRDSDLYKSFYERYAKPYNTNWVETNREKWNEYQKHYNRNHRKKWHEFDEKSKELHRSFSRKYWNEHRSELYLKITNKREELHDDYVVNQLQKEFKLSTKILRKCQILIDIKRYILSIKREIKCQQKQTKTSEHYQI